MRPVQWKRTVHVVCLCTLTLAAMQASATVNAVGVGALVGATTFVDFALIPNHTEVNSLTLGGLTFGYSLGVGKVSVSTDAGPNPTNNVVWPNILSNFSVGGWWPVGTGL